MASEPFEVTDANGITVRGSVEVSRHPKGAFNDPGSKYYRKPRYAEFDIVYSNTREACTIDRDTLSEAVQKALRDALITFGIPGPNSAAIEQDINREIDETRQRCLANADKYVSNETGFATDWATGNSVGDAAVPGGGMREPAAAENARRAFENDGRRVPNLRPDSEGGPNTADHQRVRYLSSGIAGKPVPSGFAAGITAPPLVPLDENFDLRQAIPDSRFGDGTALYPAGSSQPETPLVGLVSGKPMSFYQVQPPIWDFQSGSAPNEDAPDWLVRLLQGVRSR